ncbi:MAG: proline dehydrogenase family protein [Proteobacteria bacterium]|nr:proline dehydrogenase family protein [Pseudomonadota bacterium]
MTIDKNKLEQQILVLGKEIFAELNLKQNPFFSSQFFMEKFMNWGMKDEDLKVSLFRFVDVLPTLNSSRSVIEHLNEYLLPLRNKLPELLAKATNINPNSITAKLTAPTIKKQISFVAKQFILGETPESSLKILKKIRSRGQAFTVDLLGEATLSEAESIEYQNRYIELLTCLAAELPKWKESNPIIQGHRGETTPLNISIKLSALYSQSKALNFKQSISVLSARLAEIVSLAKKHHAFVYIDMEDSPLTSIIIETFKNIFSSEEFKDYPDCGLVLQAYMRRTETDILDLIEWTKKRGTPIAVRLVKGAYWDTESLLAQQNYQPIPVWQYKENSDANYEKLSLLLLQNYQLIYPAFASHNIRSLTHAVEAAKMLGVPHTQFELQALYGMASIIVKSFSSRGYLIREYAPIGKLIPGMGYLVRRLLENTSNEGFLRQSVHEHKSAESLLKTPLLRAEDLGTEHLHFNYREKFTNSPFRDFSYPEERDKVQSKLKDLEQTIHKQPANIFPIVAGKEIKNSGLQKLNSISPEDPDKIIANVLLADKELTLTAISNLKGFLPSWRSTNVITRAEYLFRAAEIMEKKRAELTAAIILEAGKPWAEADGDVAEAIDFLNYYALEAIKLFNAPLKSNMPGEDNSYFYEPRGITAVISPWNFPLAIPCGMFVASLVCGNCTILKPAEQTTYIAKLFFDILLEAGVPEQAICFLPAIGEEVGPTISSHPEVSTIVFTGSKSVGLKLIEEAAANSKKSTHVKKVIAEMGGKNAIIIDEDADLDEAIKGVLHSSFGFSGQKCSACSRAIVVGDNYEKFLSRLKEAAQSIILGPASDSATFVGPIIDDVAFNRIKTTIENAERECKLLVKGGTTICNFNYNGYFIKPTIFYDIPQDHSLLKDEIFGPVLAVVQATTIEQALELAMDSEYALTGAIYSRSPLNIQKAKDAFCVGNLYINRGSTGALVKRQPFGGARMSGVGSKAGGPDYLLQFVIPRVITENTIRRGFAPKS